jgi:hypothetical protein
MQRSPGFYRRLNGRYGANSQANRQRQREEMDTYHASNPWTTTSTDAAANTRHRESLGGPPDVRPSMPLASNQESAPAFDSEEYGGFDKGMEAGYDGDGDGDTDARLGQARRNATRGGHGSRKRTRYEHIYSGFCDSKEDLKGWYILRAGLAAGTEVWGADTAVSPHDMTKCFTNGERAATKGEATGNCLLDRAKQVAEKCHCYNCGVLLGSNGVVRSSTSSVYLSTLSGAAGQLLARPKFQCTACHKWEWVHPVLLGCFPASTVALGKQTWFDESVMAASRATRRHGQYGLQAWSHVIQDVQKHFQGGGSHGCGTSYKDMRSLALVSLLVVAGAWPYRCTRQQTVLQACCDKA